MATVLALHESCHLCHDTGEIVDPFDPSAGLVTCHCQDDALNADRQGDELATAIRHLELLAQAEEVFLLEYTNAWSKGACAGRRQAYLDAAEMLKGLCR